MKLYLVLTLLCVSINAHLYSMQALVRHAAAKAFQQRAYASKVPENAWLIDRLRAMEHMLAKRKGTGVGEALELQDELDTIHEFFNQDACGLPITYTAWNALTISRFYMPHPFFDKALDVDAAIKKNYKRLSAQSGLLSRQAVGEEWFRAQACQYTSYLLETMKAAEKKDSPSVLTTIGRLATVGNALIGNWPLVLMGIGGLIDDDEPSAEEVVMRLHVRYLTQRLAAIRALLPKSEA